MKRGQVEDVRAANDIVDIVSEYVRLKRVGQNFVGLCPFHTEKTPSFNVNREKQWYHCFGCSKGGDVFDFVMSMENIEFVEALKVLAERAGIVLELSSDNELNTKDYEEKEKLYMACQVAAQYFGKCLRHRRIGLAASEYLRKRGIDTSLTERFQVGFAPPSWDSLVKYLTRHGVPMDVALRAGLVSQKQDVSGFVDRFRSRIMFPIFDSWGRVVGFGGRVLGDDVPKYLNSPETPLFDKGKLLFGLNFSKDPIRRSKRAVLVEGYMDVVACFKHGIDIAVASLGTSLTPYQAKLLLRYADEVFIAYDGDAAGTNATLRALDILRNAGGTVRVVAMPDEMDPDDLLSSQGRRAFDALIESAPSLIDYKLGLVLKTADMSSIQGKVNAVSRAVEVLAQVDNAIESEEYIRKWAGKFEVAEDPFRLEITKFRRKSPVNEKSDRFEKSGNNTNVIKVVDIQDINIQRKAEIDLIRAIFKEPRYLENVKSKLELEDFTDKSCQRIIGILWETSDNRETEQIYRAFDAELGDAEKQILREIAMTNEEIQDAGRTVQDCIDCIRRHKLENKLRLLHKKIDVASEEGKFDVLRQYLKEYQDIAQAYKGVSSFKGIV